MGAEEHWNLFCFGGFSFFNAGFDDWFILEFPAEIIFNLVMPLSYWFVGPGDVDNTSYFIYLGGMLLILYVLGRWVWNLRHK
jgi:hypothetical protein